jgi:hypothetical protein
MGRPVLGECSFRLKHWAELLQANFERHFYIPLVEEDDGSYAYDPGVVHRRGIYKVALWASRAALRLGFHWRIGVRVV